MLSPKAAVLLITFNRPDTTKVVLEAIAKYKPNKLYVFSDGPRQHNLEEDVKNISTTRALFENLSWDGQIITKFMEQNQGCGPGVSGAINWAFETEEQLIILEDDCVPSMSFFKFCNSLLHKYEHDTRVMHITGTRWNEEFNVEEESYFFSKYAHIWGWATWKRAWNNYDFLMDDWKDFRRSKILNHVLDNYFPLVKRWDYMFNSIYELERKHTWDYQWQYAVFKNNGLCATPVQNLVTNIGDVGVHFNETTKAHHRNRGEMGGALIHPKYFHAHYGFDEYHGKSFFLEGRSLFRLTYDQTIGRIKYVYENNQSNQV